jgi:hypothetical protein
MRRRWLLFLLSALSTPRLAAQVDYLPAIRSAADFDAVSIAAESHSEYERLTKYLVPAREDPALLPPLFQNVARYPFHREFLGLVFPDRFPNLTLEEYYRLVEVRATRRYYAGELYRFDGADGPFHGFAVFTREAEPAELLTAAETKGIYEALSRVIDLRPLVYAPRSIPAFLAAREWVNPGFPIHLGSAGDNYQAYTRAVNYGRVRILTVAEFERENAGGRLTWQDILVLERAPTDIEGVVAGVITAEPQGELSHVALRTARRGTPNAYLPGALVAFGPLAGKLIRLEVKPAEYLAAEAPLAEAEAWWAAHRPRLSALPEIDAAHAGLDSLAEIDLAGAPESRFGGKAVNFAHLQRLLTGDLERYRAPAFAVPMRYYLEFLRANRIFSLKQPGRRVTYEEYLQELLAQDSFLGDSTERFLGLAAFRHEMMESGVVDPDLVARLAGRIAEVFGSDRTAVRFRSSSNVEDGLEFNGAGLYDSTTACAADDRDRNDSGPSLCNPLEPSERGIARALKLVWASLWNFRAYEERSYYGIPHEKTAMGVLVTAAFLDEATNGVAFTGNPANPLDRRYVAVAQVGEESVVHPAPGVLPEKDVLEVEGGAVQRIDRVQRSSLVSPGEVLLSDRVLRELAGFLWRLDRDFPIDLGNHDRAEVLFDVEFKVDAAGELAVKQVRPFLAETGPAGPTFALEVPAGTATCGVFVDAREPWVEYEVKSQVRWVAGRHELPSSRPVFAGRLFEEVLFGPGRERAAPASPGRFRVELRATGTGEATYTYRYEETFTLADGKPFRIEVQLPFSVLHGEPREPVRVLSEDFIAQALFAFGVPGDDRRRLVRYASCEYPGIPRWMVHAELDGGLTLDLEERFQPTMVGSGPAALARATVAIGDARREVNDYWHLVYAALHHNVNVRHWVVLDPPLAVPGLPRPAGVIEVSAPEHAAVPARARLLDAGFAVLAEPAVPCWWKVPLGESRSCGFRRGDADANRRTDLTDAIAVLASLFAGGRAVACPDAADFDDDGFADVTDAILILIFLFRGTDLSAPPGPFECGRDPTEDRLPVCAGEGCG